MAYTYIPAKWQWNRRLTPSLLVIHSMEAPEKGDTAESCANYFKRGTKVASAHLCIDNNTVVQSVPYDREAAGAKGGPYRGTSVNASAIHFEHAGYARQTPAEWADEYSQKMLFISTLAAADVCRRYKIPAFHLSHADLRAGRSGICTHNDITYAFNVYGGHTDPGAGFPMNSYVGLVNYWLNYPGVPDTEDDMYTDADRAELKALRDEVAYLRHVQDDILRPKLDAVYIDTHADDHNSTLAGRMLNVAKELNVPTQDA